MMVLRYRGDPAATGRSATRRVRSKYSGARILIFFIILGVAIGMADVVLIIFSTVNMEWVLLLSLIVFIAGTFIVSCCYFLITRIRRAHKTTTETVYIPTSERTPTQITSPTTINPPTSQPPSRTGSVRTSRPASPSTSLPPNSPIRRTSSTRSSGNRSPSRRSPSRKRSVSPAARHQTTSPETTESNQPNTDNYGHLTVPQSPVTIQVDPPPSYEDTLRDP